MNLKKQMIWKFPPSSAKTVKMKLGKEFTTVTTLSKTLAMILFIALPIYGFFLGVKYAQPSYTEPKPVILVNLPPDKVAQNFYNEYIKCLEANADCDYKKSKYVSSDLEKNIQGKINPIMCSQNFPAEVRVDSPAINGNKSQVTAHHIYESSGDNPIKVDLVRLGDTWKISNITCKTP